jgi:NAD(P)-dependent dehydrogenase (short-subunit alcohol dehydrogenase family)
MSWGPFGLDGKTAIITGAAKGIGFGCARLFLQAGANVLIADTDAEASTAALRTLALVDTVGRAATCPVDITVPHDIDRMVACCIDEFGSVDVLVNNAGIYPAATFDEMTPEHVQRLLRVNVEGPILTTRAVALRMRAQGRGGAIVNMGSMGALRGSHPGLITYGASKGAVHSFTLRASAALAPDGIRVNAIAPGSINTESANALTDASDERAQAALAAANAQIPLGRFGTPDDIAPAAVFLASDAARYITGVTILVDGGRMAQ